MRNSVFESKAEKKEANLFMPLASLGDNIEKRLSL